jgi:hypothetical protein
MDLKRERVKIDWVGVIKAFECPNILLLAAPIANSFIGKCILETIVLLYLYHDVALFICHQITFFILRLASF